MSAHASSRVMSRFAVKFAIPLTLVQRWMLLLSCPSHRSSIGRSVFRVVGVQRRAGVVVRFGSVQRTDAKVIPHQRINKAGPAVERVCSRLAFPTSAHGPLRRGRIQSAFALRADQSQHAGLIFRKLMCETMCDLREFVLHIFNAKQTSGSISIKICSAQSISGGKPSKKTAELVLRPAESCLLVGNRSGESFPPVCGAIHQLAKKST